MNYDSIFPVEKNLKKKHLLAKYVHKVIFQTYGSFGVAFLFNHMTHNAKILTGNFDIDFKNVHTYAVYFNFIYDIY